MRKLKKFPSHFEMMFRSHDLITRYQQIKKNQEGFKSGGRQTCCVRNPKFSRVYMIFHNDDVAISSFYLIYLVPAVIFNNRVPNELIDCSAWE